MPESERTQEQERRAEARRLRRESPSQTADEPAGGGDVDEQEHDAHAGLRQAAKAAAAGAAVGAAVGAALAARDDDAEPDEGDAAAPAEPRRAVALEDRSGVEPLPVDQAEDEAQDEPADARDDRAEASVDAEPRPRAEPEPRHGASPDEAAEVVRRAREQLEALQGREPEVVSSLERTADGWTVTLEVVELARVPDSTDVLASYEVVLDGDKNVIRCARGRRYYRSQADRDGGQ